MVLTTGDFQKALKPVIKDVFGLAYRDYPVLHKEFMIQATSNDAYEEDLLMSGLGLGKEKAQGAAASYDDMSQGYVKRYDHVMYANGFVITREMIEDGKAPARAEAFTKSLKKGMLDVQDIVATNVLNRAFSSTYVGGDGVELCSSAHPTRAGNLRNELAVAASPSEAAFEQAIIDLQDMRDDRGLRVMAKAKKLVIPTAEGFNVDRILNSVARVGTANNDKNAVAGKFPAGVLENPYLTDTNAWFIITDVDQGLKFITRTALRMEEDNDFDTFNAKFLASARFSVGWSDPRGVFGSEGA